MTPDQVGGLFDAGEGFLEGTIAAALVMLWLIVLALYLARPYMTNNLHKFTLRLGADLWWIVYVAARDLLLVQVFLGSFIFFYPDVVSGKTIRRVVLSVADVAAKLSACGTMLCSDGDIGEGMTIDFDAGPRLNYWFVGNDQLVQYSGTAEPASLKLTADTLQRLAGKWDYDGSAAGGPRVQIEFDAPLVKEVTKLR